MVTSPHEASHRIFQDRPELLTPAFRILGVHLPPRAAVTVLSPDATEIRPLERRVDSVLRVEPEGGSAFLLAIEAQGRKDAAKASSWAYYLCYLQAKYEMPALLLVVCQDRPTATWAAGPFDMGLTDWPALTLRPLVLGPANVPVITDPAAAAQDFTLAVFSAMTHGRRPDPTAILEALATALGALEDRNSAMYYTQLLEIGLGDTPARKIWRDMMSAVDFFPGRGTIIEESYLEGEAKGKAKGKAEGEAEGLAKGRTEAILRVLEQRRITVPDSVRTRITTCTDLDALSHMLDRSFMVTTAEELFTTDDNH